MAFTIELIRNNSPANYVNKSLTTLANLSGTLKDNCSVEDPVVLVESNDTSLLSNLNYVYIFEFKRYYYVKDITLVRNNLWSVSLHVDVLMSWRNNLKQNQGVVRRQASRWNLYLDDGVFKAYQDPLIKTVYFPNGFSTPEYVLAIAGAEDDTP